MDKYLLHSRGGNPGATAAHILKLNRINNDKKIIVCEVMTSPNKGT
jgi:hypothetical protein